MGTQTDLMGGGGGNDYDLQTDKILIPRPMPVVSAEIQTDLRGGGEGEAYDSEEAKILVARPISGDANQETAAKPTRQTIKERASLKEQIEAEANMRMQQPPPQPSQQSSPPTEDGNAKDKNSPPKIDYSDGFGLFLISDLIEFIQELTYHAAECNGLFQLNDIDFREGAGIKQVWACKCCNKSFIHSNCKSIKTGVIEPGRKFARSQPELNIRIVEAAREVGINLQKLVDFLAFVGVKASKYESMLHQEKKIRVAIEDLSEARLVGNLREHTIAARGVPNYQGDIVWSDDSGAIHNTARGPGSFDGAGLTRAYGHKIKGSRACMIVFSLLTGKPIMVAYDSVG